MAGTYKLIASTTLASATNSVTFTNLSSAFTAGQRTYAELYLRGTFSYAAADAPLVIQFRINSLSTSIYGYAALVMRNTGTPDAPVNQSLSENLASWTTGTSYSSLPVNFEMQIPAYYNTNFRRNLQTQFTFTPNSGGAYEWYIGAVSQDNDVNAINSISLYPQSGGASPNFAANSKFYLYGVNGSL